MIKGHDPRHLLPVLGAGTGSLPPQVAHTTAGVLRNNTASATLPNNCSTTTARVAHLHCQVQGECSPTSLLSSCEAPFVDASAAQPEQRHSPPTTKARQQAASCRQHHWLHTAHLHMAAQPFSSRCLRHQVQMHACECADKGNEGVAAHCRHLSDTKIHKNTRMLLQQH